MAEENIRKIAVEILMEVCEKEAYSNQILSAVLDKYAYWEKNKRAFLTRLVEGTLEKRIRLDYIIDSFSKVKVKKQKPFIRNLLRMSVYQLKYMDAVPDSAVCNEAVKLAKSRGFGRLSGFVNGVLRTIARQPDPTEKLDEKSDPVTWLEIMYSTPRWMVQQWMQQYGYEKTKKMLEEFSETHPLTIRVNRSRCTPDELREMLKRDGVTVRRAGNADYAFDITGFDRLERLTAFQEGLFYVQDLSSMMVAEWALETYKDRLEAAKRAEKPSSEEEPVCVIDVCSAPGGKATHMAEMLGKSGMVDARDLTEAKVERIRENIEALELPNISAKVWDALKFDEASVKKADILLCDLPCSGLGVIGKKKDIRYRMTAGKQKELAQLQRQILETVHSYVKPGGILIYSTCTIGRLENEENTAWFLEKFPQFSLVRMEQLFPGKENHDGFFIAKMVRKQD